MPVTKKEWLDARLNCKVGDSIRVFNHWREDLKAKQGKDVNTTRKHYAAIEDDRRRSAANKVTLREKYDSRPKQQ